MELFYIKDAFSEVIIAPELGGSVLAYTSEINGQKREVFRTEINPEQVTDTCCFPLVPFSNRIKHGKFLFHDKAISLPLNALPEVHAHHGHGWQTSWQVDNVQETSITLSYHYQPDAWPYAYTAKQQISLDNGMLMMSLTLTNNSDQEMPAGLGFHPYFTRTAESALHSQITQMWQVDSQCLPTHQSEAPASLMSAQGMKFEGSDLDNAFANFPHKAVITWPEWQAKAEMTTSDNCDFLVVYSPNEENFSCVEPVTHLTDAFNRVSTGQKNTGFRIIKAKESMTIWMKIKPSSI
ncbi:aldose 1-epimerase [Thalassotalea sp. PLHSN55]|uniref:aldose 1-epimerase n=1 Tax=Thalassotalea sp. PLHSN55 TaxID=3435888 RepID=UPI003F848AEB